MKTIIIIFSFSTNLFTNDGLPCRTPGNDTDILINSEPLNYQSQIPIPCKDRKNHPALFKEKKDNTREEVNPAL